MDDMLSVEWQCTPTTLSCVVDEPTLGAIMKNYDRVSITSRLGTTDQ